MSFCEKAAETEKVLYVFGVGHLAEVQFFRWLFSNPFHGLWLCHGQEGGRKGKKLLRSKERYHVSRIIFFKILVTVAKTFIHLAALVLSLI